MSYNDKLKKCGKQEREEWNADYADLADYHWFFFLVPKRLLWNVITADAEIHLQTILNGKNMCR